jgi:DNA modification methylase
MKPYYENEAGVIYHGDCLEILPEIEKVDLVLTDPPYGTTGNNWDNELEFEMFWKIKSNGFIACASQPFTTKLIFSNIAAFRHSWIWNKHLAGNGMLAKKQPLKIHEDVCVFGDIIYSPKKRKGLARTKGGIKDRHGTFGKSEAPEVFGDEYYPVSIIDCSGAAMRGTRQHPTQKPVALFVFLLENYQARTILDPFLGSGTTAVAAMMLNRRFIGIELEEKYCEISAKRCEQTRTGLTPAEQESGQQLLFE